MRSLGSCGLSSGFLLVAFALGVYPRGMLAQGVEVFAPRVVSVEGESLFRGSFSPDGQSFYFFRQVGDEDFRIWVAHRRDGGWSPAERVVLGGEHSDLYPTISPDGERMIFTSYRPVPSHPEPQANLWMVTRRGEVWGEPVYLESLSDPEAYNAGPVWEPGGVLRYKEITWGPAGRRLHLRAFFDGEGFGPPEFDPDFRWENWRSGKFVWDAIRNHDGSMVVLEVSNVESETGERSPPDLWVSHRITKGWTAPTPIEGVNMPEATENFPLFTPDGSELLFVRDFRTYYRVSVESLKQVQEGPPRR